MALIHCIECGEQVSSMASACPRCGFPIRPADSEPLYRAYRRRRLIAGAVIGAIAVPVGLVLQAWIIVAMGVLAVAVATAKLRRPLPQDEGRS